MPQGKKEGDVQGDPRLATPQEGVEDPFAPEPPHEGEVTDAMVIKGSPHGPDGGSEGEGAEGEGHPAPKEETPKGKGPSDGGEGIVAGGREFGSVADLKAGYEELQTRMGRQGTEVGDLRNEVMKLTKAVDDRAAKGGDGDGETPSGPQLRDYAEIEERSDDPNAGFNALAEDLQKSQGDNGLTREDVAEVVAQDREVQRSREAQWDAFVGEHPHLEGRQKLVAYVAEVEVTDAGVSGMNPKEIRAEIARLAEGYLVGANGSGKTKDPNRKPLPSGTARAEGGSTRKSAPSGEPEPKNESISSVLSGKQARMRSSGHVQTE
tara:strand:- start:3258 stop:4220 length:963 start_codon:yes stop_codon:yes gene_type:complete